MADDDLHNRNPLSPAWSHIFYWHDVQRLYWINRMVCSQICWFIVSYQNVSTQNSFFPFVNLQFNRALNIAVISGPVLRLCITNSRQIPGKDLLCYRPKPGISSSLTFPPQLLTSLFLFYKSFNSNCSNEQSFLVHPWNLTQRRLTNRNESHTVYLKEGRGKWDAKLSWLRALLLL